MLHQVMHRVGQCRVLQQVIAVVAVFVELVQVDVIEAGAAVEHAVIDHETFQMQYAEQFTGLHRYTVDRHFAGMGAGLFLVPRRVARLLLGADQSALGP